MVEFAFEGVVWQVRFAGDFSSNVVFRDKAHLGGPWSSVKSYVDDKSIKAGFRRRLKAARDKLRAERANEMEQERHMEQMMLHGTGE